MDLAEILDVTDSVDCEFMDRKITAHYYTAGRERVTKEQQEELEPFIGLASRTEEEIESLPEDEQRKARLEAYGRSVDGARALLPIVLARWDLDGTPMEYQGADFPPTPENIKRCPDSLLLAVASEVVPAWSKLNPTNGGPPQNGSPQEERLESIPAENTLPSVASALPPNG